MPVIPEYLSRQGLASSSETPRGGVGIPVVGQPAADAAGQTAGSRGLDALGAGAGQAAGYLAQAEALRAHTTRAQDLLDSKTGLQTFRQALQPAYQEELNNPEYATLGSRVLARGKTLIDQHSATLRSPQAQALFREDAEQALTLTQQHALGEEGRRRQGAAQLMISREVQQAQESIARAQNDVDRLAAQNGLEDTLLRAVSVGLVDGAVAGKILTQTDEAVRFNNGAAIVRTNPARAITDLDALLRDPSAKVAFPALSQVPPGKLPELYDTAVSQLKERVSADEHRAAAAKRHLQERQALTASTFQQRITGTTGVTVADMVALLPELNQARQRGELGEQDYRQLTQDAQALIGRLREDAYKDRDVPQVAQEAILRIEAAQTPGELDRARSYVQENTANLSTGRIQGLLETIRRRRDQENPLNNDVAKEARREFLSGFFPGGIVPAVLEKIEPAIKTQSSAGLRTLNDELQRIYTEQGVTAMERQAIGIARELRESYLPLEQAQVSSLLKGLPPEYLQVQTREEGLRILRQQIGTGTPTAAQQLIFRRLNALPSTPPVATTPRVQPPGAPPAPTAPRTGRER